MFDLQEEESQVRRSSTDLWKMHDKVEAGEQLGIVTTGHCHSNRLRSVCGQMDRLWTLAIPLRDQPSMD